MVKDINPGFPGFGIPSSGSPSNLTNVNETLFFTADDGVNGYEGCGRATSTTAGTVMVKDIRMGSATAYAVPDRRIGLTDVDGTLYFQAD